MPVYFWIIVLVWLSVIVLWFILRSLYKAIYTRLGFFIVSWFLSVGIGASLSVIILLWLRDVNLYYGKLVYSHGDNINCICAEDIAHDKSSTDKGL